MKLTSIFLKKIKRYGSEKRRGWIKLHIAVEPKTRELTAQNVSNNKTADSQILPILIDKVQANGAYDRATCREHLLKRHIEACIPPRRKGRQREGDEFIERNSDLKAIDLFWRG